jgi:hypothetical protein
MKWGDIKILFLGKIIDKCGNSTWIFTFFSFTSRRSTTASNSAHFGEKNWAAHQS